MIFCRSHSSLKFHLDAEQWCHRALLLQHRESRGWSRWQPWQLLTPRLESDSARALRCMKVSCNKPDQDDINSISISGNFPPLSEYQALGHGAYESNHCHQLLTLTLSTYTLEKPIKNLSTSHSHVVRVFDNMKQKYTFNIRNYYSFSEADMWQNSSEKLSILYILFIKASDIISIFISLSSLFMTR